jgi:hypothetical protein
MINAGKLRANTIAPMRRSSLSEYFMRIFPATNLKTSDDIPMVPTRMPMSCLAEPTPARKMGSVGVRAWKAEAKQKKAQNARMKSRVNRFSAEYPGMLFSLRMVP